jgi:uncharacterized protein YdiU (UPF0061 family)
MRVEWGADHQPEVLPVMSPSAAIPFDNTYVRLPARFYSLQSPTPVAAPALIRANDALAHLLQIDPAWLHTSDALAVFAGNTVPPNAQPIATVYAGHQFGGWNPQLGDGRAILLGEVVGTDGRRYDIQLKGAGETPYSRNGDGRSPLGPVLREYIVSEAMAALGVPTTRSLAAVTSGERVVRDSLLPGGVLTRVASSHIRIGTFQFFTSRNDDEAVRLLAGHVIARHYPQSANAENPYRALLDAAIARQARLIAQWQSIGFIHGVMNTDNMLLCGETIDYGPCAFMDAFHPGTVFSSIDHRGRYAYQNQPAIAQWNLSWLAQSLLPLLAENREAALEIARASISGFVGEFDTAYRPTMLGKLGLHVANDENIALLNDLLQRMDQASADFTLTFRTLADLADESAAEGIAALYEMPGQVAQWLPGWRAALAREPVAAGERQRQMRAVNPAFIPRNHQVEAAIDAAVTRSDFAPFYRLVERLARPFVFDPDDAPYALPPRPDQVVARTFCGT